MDEKSDLSSGGTPSSSDDSSSGQSVNPATTSASCENPVVSPPCASPIMLTTDRENAPLSQQELFEQGVTITMTQNSDFKSLWVAYLLWFPLGLLGLHNFYLGRRNFGILYAISGGVVSIGWIVDGLRMPSLVRDANKRIGTTGIGRDDDEEQINLTDSYILWFPYGLLGLHHFYLGRTLWGVAYMFTGGLFAIGWLVDLFRLPELVEEANQRIRLERANLQAPIEKNLCDAYHFGLTPVGLLGAHHFYLGRKMFGIFYMTTAGGFGIGWIVDWIRMPLLVERANNPERNANGTRRKYIDDAYVLAFPFGFMGLHHFYLEQPKWGMLYLLTGGLLGLGWLRDLATMPQLVDEANARLEQQPTQVQTSQHIQLTNNVSMEGTTMCTVASGEKSITFACQSIVLQLNGHVTMRETDGRHMMIVTNPTNTQQVAAPTNIAPPPYTEVPTHSR